MRERERGGGGDREIDRVNSRSLTTILRQPFRNFYRVLPIS